MVLIDATDRIMGRLASLIAKKLLAGEEVVVVNAENIVISGDPKTTKQKFLKRRQRGSIQKGPFYPRYPDAIFRRVVRGMLPKRRREATGRDALKRLKVYAKQPIEYKNVKKFGKGLDRLECKFIYLKDVSKFLGAKI